MKIPARAALTLMLMGTAAAFAQTPGTHRPDNSHPGTAANNHPAPPAAMRGQPNRPAPTTARGQANRSGPVAHRHHLPPGIAAPAARHRAPVWHGRSWAVGDLFIFTGFRGPTISDWRGYDLTAPRPGTHWIYVDGFFLMVGNRTGHIFAEIPADY